MKTKIETVDGVMSAEELRAYMKKIINKEDLLTIDKAKKAVLKHLFFQINREACLLRDSTKVYLLDPNAKEYVISYLTTLGYMVEYKRGSSELVVSW